MQIWTIAHSHEPRPGQLWRPKDKTVKCGDPGFENKSELKNSKNWKRSDQRCKFNADTVRVLKRVTPCGNALDTYLEFGLLLLVIGESRSRTTRECPEYYWLSIDISRLEPCCSRVHSQLTHDTGGNQGEMSPLRKRKSYSAVSTAIFPLEFVRVFRCLTASASHATRLIIQRPYRQPGA